MIKAVVLEPKKGDEALTKRRKKYTRAVKKGTPICRKAFELEDYKEPMQPSEPLSPLQQDMLEETLADVQNLLYSTVHDFMQRYPGETWGFDTLLSQVSLGFVEAYRRYKPEKGKFSNWVRFIAWSKCLEYRRDQSMKLRGLSFIDMTDPVLQFEAKQSKFKLSAFMSEISDDAKAVVQLVVDSEICTCATCKMLWRKDSTKLERRKTLKSFLVEQVGWSTDRVWACFKEIGLALKEARI